MKSIIAWFSGGVTSAVATKLAIIEHERVQPVFIETGGHHSDMPRFIEDCEDWFKVKILILQDHRFADHIDLISRGTYVNGVKGAECSRTLKKKVRQKFEQIFPFVHQVFGFEFEKSEVNRAVRFEEQNPQTKPLFPLIDHRINKPGAMEIVLRAGIELPTMYRLGYSNNNCIGCVKGGKGYWNKIRVDFPEQFERMAKVEREIGGTCIKGVYLDELDPSSGREEKMLMPECDLFCEIEAANIMSDKTEALMGKTTPKAQGN